MMIHPEVCAVTWLIRPASVAGQNGGDDPRGDRYQHVVTVDAQPAVVARRCRKLTGAPVGYPVAVVTILLIDDSAALPLLVRNGHSGLWTEVGIAISRLACMGLTTGIALLLWTILRSSLTWLLAPILLTLLTSLTLLALVLAALWALLLLGLRILGRPTRLSDTGQRRAKHQQGAEHSEIFFHQRSSFANSNTLLTEPRQANWRRALDPLTSALRQRSVWQRKVRVKVTYLVQPWHLLMGVDLRTVGRFCSHGVGA